MPKSEAATRQRDAEDPSAQHLLERAEQQFPGVRELEATYELIEKNAAKAIDVARAAQTTVHVYSASGAD